MDLQHYGEVAEQAARRAGAILRKMASEFSVREKGRGDLVTTADVASQEAIRQVLLGEFPNHAFVGEEGQQKPDPTAEFRWIVDPLDGTSNYVHGVEFYAVSIGLEARGQLVAGVIYDPNADHCFKATAGGGAFLNLQPIRVSQVSRLRDALIVTGFPPNIRGRADLWRLFEEFCSESHSVRRLGSSALDLAYVAWGRFDAFYSLNHHCWDVAAGVLILREAGGHVTNLTGSTHDLYAPSILATNGLVHQEAIAVVKRALDGA